MSETERIIALCNSRAALCKADALNYTGEKKAWREGAAKACRTVVDSYAHYDLAALQRETEQLAKDCNKQANDIRHAFPLLSASFEGHACAYKEIAGLCQRTLEPQDDHAYDAWREQVSPQREQQDYREDVRRGMLP